MPTRLATYFRQRPVLLALVLALGVRLLWFSVAEVGVSFQRPKSTQFVHRSQDGLGYRVSPVQAIDMWVRWDGAFYQRIAEHGYHSPPKNLTTAFFPLFPLLVAGTSALTSLDTITAGLLLSNLVGVLAWVLLALWARHRVGDLGAALFILLFAVFPSRNFEMSLYTESLFLATAAGAFLAFERRQLGVATLCAILASACRPQGALVGGALFLGALVERLRPRDSDDRPKPPLRHIALLGLSPLGLLAYMAYLHASFGNALMFLDIQRIWRRHLTTPLHTLLAGSADPHVYAIVLLSIGAVVLMLRKSWPSHETLYAAGSLALPLSTGSLQSFARFAGVVFPIFLVASVYLGERPRALRAYLVIAIIYSLVFAFKVGQGMAVL